MNQLILKPEIVEKIKVDAELYGKVAKALGIGAPSLRSVLKANHPKLTQAAPMRVLMDYLGMEDNDLLQTVQDQPEPLKQSAA